MEIKRIEKIVTEKIRARAGVANISENIIRVSNTEMVRTCEEKYRQNVI